MMTEKKRWPRKFSTAALLLGLLLAALLLVPGLISTEGFKGRIQTVFQEQTGGQLNYQSAEIVLLPRPGIEVVQLQVRVPDRLEGTVETLMIYPELFPLLSGQVKVSGLELDRPELRLGIPGEAGSPEGDDPSVVSSKPSESLAQVTDLLSGQMPRADLRITRGEISLSQSGRARLQLQQLDLEASLDAADGGAGVDLSGNIGLLRLDLQGKAIELEEVDVAGVARFAEGDLKISLATLKLARPALQLSGEMVVKSLNPTASLELTGRQVDVAAVRNTVLVLAGGNKVAEDIFSYLRGGVLEEITFSSRGRKMADLGDLRKIAIEGRLKEGAITIPAIRMDLAEVSGDVTIAEGVLHGSGLSARLDQSSGRDGRLDVDLSDTAGPFHLDLQVDADLQQLHTVLGEVVDHADFVEELQRVTHIKGQGQGRLVLGDSLDHLQVQVEVQDLNLSADYRRLPFPVSIQRGQLSFAGDHIEIGRLAGTVGASRFSDVTFQLGWQNHLALMASSGQFRIALEELPPWLKMYPDFQPALSLFRQPRGELGFVTTGLKWHPESGFDVKGRLDFPQGPAVTADLSVVAGRVTARQLDIDDQGSRARLLFDVQPRELRLNFSGQLQQATLDRMFLSGLPGEGLLEGDFKLTVLQGQPEKSVVQGKLSGRDISLPLVATEPLTIRNLDLAAERQQVNVRSAELTWGDNDVDLSGRIDVTSSGMVLDLEARAGDLTWVPGKQEDEPAAPAGQGRGLPDVTGDIRLQAASFTLGGLTWEPLQAVISLLPEKTDIRIDRAELCGISSPGTLIISDDQLDLDFQLLAKDQEIAPRYACLTNNRVKMTGSFDLEGTLAADGRADELLSNARGVFVVEARNGRITQDKTLARTMEVINVTEIVKGKLPDLRADGFDYESISVDAELQGEELLLKKYQMDGKTLDILGQGTINLVDDRIDAQLMAAPLKTVDSVIKKLPGINYLLAGSLVAIPVSIQGSLHDPQVKVMAPSAIGSGLLGLAERVIKSPVKLIESALPEEKQE